MEKKDIENILPLTPIQEGILFHAIQNPSNDVYYEQYNCLIRGHLNVEAFHTAWQKVVDRHSVLRTQFLWENRDKPLQIVRTKSNITFQIHDFSTYSANEQRIQKESLISLDEKIGFDLSKPCLLRIHIAKLSSNEYFLIWSFHHIILDGWCLGVVLSEVASIYNSISTNNQIHLSQPKQYKEYIGWLKNQKLEKSENFWKFTLEGFTSPTKICIDNNNNSVHGNLTIKELHKNLTVEISEKLTTFSKSHKITINTILQATWSLLLHFYSDKKDVLHGTTVSTRPIEIEGVDSILGLFINTIPVRSTINFNKNCIEWLNEQQDAFSSCMPHFNVPLQRIIAASELNSDQALFDSLVVFENYPFGEFVKNAFSGIKIEDLQYVEKANFPLTIVIVPDKQFLIRILFDTNRFAENEIVLLLNRFSTTLNFLLNNENNNLSQVYFLDEEEQEVHLSHTCKNTIINSDLFYNLFANDLETNNPIYVLNGLLKPKPINQAGKLYIGKHSAEFNKNTDIQNPHSIEYNQLIDTSFEAMFLYNNELQIISNNNRIAYFNNEKIELSEIESIITNEDGIENCVVCEYENSNISNCLVAYVVSNKEINSQELKEKLSELLPAQKIPTYFVTVSKIPYTSEGFINYHELSKVEIIDAEILLQCQNDIKHQNGIVEAVAISSNVIIENEVIHVSDIIANWKEIYANSKSPEKNQNEVVEIANEISKPATCVGAQLNENELPTNLSEVIIRAANNYFMNGVTYIDNYGNESFQSYHDILVDAKKILHGLQKQGIVPKDKIIFQLKYNRDFINAFWACQLGGFVPVPLSNAVSYLQANNDVKKLKNAWVMLNNPVILTDVSTQPSIDALNNLFDDWNATTIAVEHLLVNTESSEIYSSDKNDVAILLLTSGSTGMPKAVMQTHFNLIRRSAGTSLFNGDHVNDISFNWMPLDHVGGIVMFTLRDTYVGCQHIVAPTNYILEEPLRWLDIMSKHKVSVTWAPNFAYGLVNEQLRSVTETYYWDLSHLRFILNAGEAIVAKTARLFMKNLLPYNIQPTAMKPCWGMSETCSGVLYNNQFLLENTSDNDQYVVVGEPIPGFEVRITNNGHLVNEGETGNLEVRGASVTIGYFNNETINAESYTHDGWFKTGDLAIVNNRNVIIAGRKKDEIIINGINYNNAEIELVVDEMEEIETSFSAVCSYRINHSDTDSVALFFCPKQLHNATLATLVSKVKEKVIHSIGINLDMIIPVEKEQIPKTGIGKIQRAKLKDQLLAGEFDKEIKKVDVLLKNNNTIPNWFFKRTWIEKNEFHKTPLTENNVVVIFGNPSLLVTGIQSKIESQCKSVIIVSASNSYQKISDTSFSIDISNSADYQSVLQEIHTSNPSNEFVYIHMFTTEFDAQIKPDISKLKELQNYGLFSVMHLTQALEKHSKIGETIKMFVVSELSQHVGMQKQTNFAHSTLFGFIKTAKHEIPWLTIRHIDIDDSSYLSQIQQVWNELNISETNQEIVYRNEKRLVSALKPVKLREKTNSNEVFQTEGVYLVTGGFGGIGTEIIILLSQKYNCRFIIIGKTDLPSKDTWNDYVSNDSVVGKRIQSAQQLNSAGVDFEYHSINLTDSDKLMETVSNIEKETNTKLAGILHLAGEGNLNLHWKDIENHQIVNETEQTFQTMFNPKVYGTFALFQLLETRPNCHFINFSSINGLFGGSTFSAYSSANSFQDTFTEYLYKLGFSVHCFSWSMWENIGMSENNPDFANDAAKIMGYSIISKQKGINSLLAGIQNLQGHTIVGLDVTNKNITKLLSTNNYLATKKIALFYTGVQNEAFSITVKDVLNNTIVADYIHVTDIPLKEGNVDFSQLESIRQKSIGKTKEKIAATTPTEKRIFAIWRDVLTISEISVTDNFFELGGHSLKATQVISRIKKEFEIELPLTQLFQNPTIKDLALVIDQISNNGTSKSLEIKHIENKENIPLSYSQQRLWFLKQYEPESSFYNIPETVRFYGNLQIDVMQRCIDEIIQRHESLRTVFIYQNGQVNQVIKPFVSQPFDRLDLSSLAPAERESKMLDLATIEAGKNFHIDKGPLIRITLVKMDENDHVVFLTMHHIISDGWSIGIFVREFMHLFAAFSQNNEPQLPKLTIQYSDFSIWQRQWFESTVKEEQLKYWKNKLGTNLATLELPIDKPRPLIETHHGARYYFTVPKEDAQLLETVCKQSGATLYMVLLAAFKTLLFRYTSQTDIVVGSSIANRNHREIEGLIGFFVNSLVLRTDLSDSPTFNEVIQRVKQTTIEAYSNQDIPFEMLVEELEVKRDLSRNPLFQVMFALQNQSVPNLEIDGLRIERIEIDNHANMFDIWLSMNESPNGIQAICEYNTDLWENDTIARMMNHFMTIIKNVAINPNEKISNIDLLTKLEIEQQNSWNNTEMLYPQDKCTFHLFEEQAALTPEKVAVRFENKSLTYRELNEKSNQLAHHLIELGVATEDLVGICINRSIEMLISLLAVHKAGAAYIPLDPVYPKDRIALILEDAQPKVFITRNNLLESLPELNSTIVFVEEDTLAFEKYPISVPNVIVTPRNLAYIIYTSGSTGKPKGVQIEHYSLLNFLKSMSIAPGITANDIWLAVTTISFDISGLEMFLPIIEGATIEIANADVTKDAFQLMELIQSSNATIMQATPATWRMLILAEWTGNKNLKILCGGEAFPKKLANQLLHKVESIWNMYGPTETTIWSTLQKVSASDLGNSDEGYVNIGVPIANTQIYIVDSCMNRLPVGVPGELLIGGDGLARGYYLRDELNIEKFIFHTFKNQEQSRLYRTGDLARFLPNGKIEYINRIDNQVKIRGFRIELGEIESVINAHTKVSNAAVIVQETDNDENRLVAYVVRKDDKVIENNDKYNDEQVAQWETVFENAYLEPETKIEDPTFNILCWYSSYTGKLIPEIEMKEWLDTTIQTILNYKPQHVLEIGCGTGLILFRVAPHCESYTGTDIAKNGVEYISNHANDDIKNKISLFHRDGNDFSGFAENQFDTIIINSVIQYFPNIEYLNEVIQKAIHVLKPNGRLIIGDVRSLPLLETYHTSVELHKADDTLSMDEFKKRIHNSIEQENELLINPGYFYATKAKFPAINKIRISPRKGVYHNELSKFRYQAIIQVGEKIATQPLEWWDWHSKQLNIALLQNLLKTNKPESIGISNIPNARLVKEEQARRLVEQKETPKTIGMFKELMKSIVIEGIDPDQFYSFEDIGYHVEFDWSRHGRFGEFDIILIHKEKHPNTQEYFDSLNFIDEKHSDASLNDYANNPLQWKFNSDFVPELKRYMSEKLPEYMVPSFFVLMNDLPLTPNGKLNRKALPAPENNRKYLETVYQAPSGEMEQKIAEIWQDILHVDKIGINDNFFDLGGQSLSMVLVHSKIRELFKSDISVVELFQYPTISKLATYLNTGNQVSVVEQVSERVENRKDAMIRNQEMRKQKQR